MRFWKIWWGSNGDWENCVRSEDAYFEGDWGIIVPCAVFLLSCIFCNKCVYFSCHVTGYFLDRPCIYTLNSLTYMCALKVNWYISYFFNICVFIFRERGREGEREGEKHWCVVASRAPLIGDQACNPGMCPDWESNQRSFGLQASTWSTEPHQPWVIDIF